MGMASIWTGALTFGLVNIPVSLASAVRAAEKTSFRQLHKDDMTPIKYERVCPTDGEVVPWNEIVKGYEYSKGKYVVVTSEELAKVKTPSSKAVEMMDFVKSDEIDPRYFDTPYYLVPQKGGEKPYALLREALENTNMVGIGKLTLRQKEHLVAVRPLGDALILELMRFQDELVAPEGLRFPDAEQQKLRSGIDRIWHAIGFSFSGLKAGWAETAFRQEAMAAIVLVPLSFWVGRSWVEVALLAGSVLIVLAVELLNTAIETCIDRVGAEWHELSKRAKDMGSAAVFLSLFLAAGIWLAALVQLFSRT